MLAMIILCRRIYNRRRKGKVAAVSRDGHAAWRRNRLMLMSISSRGRMSRRIWHFDGCRLTARASRRLSIGMSFLNISIWLSPRDGFARAERQRGPLAPPADDGRHCARPPRRAEYRRRALHRPPPQSTAGVSSRRLSPSLFLRRRAMAASAYFYTRNRRHGLTSAQAGHFGRQPCVIARFRRAPYRDMTRSSATR